MLPLIPKGQLTSHNVRFNQILNGFRNEARVKGFTPIIEYKGRCHVVHLNQQWLVKICVSN